MSREDWAIVIGISRYPGFHDLAGSENDARSFFDWVSHPSGGSVPPEQARLLVSSQFPPSAAVAAARPNMSDAIAGFEHLDDVASRNDAQGNGAQVGRRLYLYLSGQGYAASFEDTAVLLANATTDRPGYHIPGQPWAKWLLQAGYFEEVLLFMDCSRDYLLPQVPVNALPFVGHAQLPRRGRFFSAVATRWSSSARERVIDGVPRGVFTTALLAGLQGAASDGEGRITAKSLGAYLYNDTKKFLLADERQNPDIVQFPEVTYSGDADDFVLLDLGLAAVPRPTVRLELTEEAVGKSIEILSSRLELVTSISPTSSRETNVQLPPGLYLARVGDAGRQTLFEVTGAGGDHVVL